MVITVDDFDEAFRFYRETLGLELAAEWDTEMGHGVLFSVGRGTIELFDRRQKESIDTLEAGHLTAGDVRIALEVDDVDGTASTLTAAGTRSMSDPFDAPWGDRIARLETPHGMQLTLFSLSGVE
jgi:catechol 2,3-dioxygenase-like lactoylglutathione lyase family enzyme